MVYKMLITAANKSAELPDEVVEAISKACEIASAMAHCKRRHYHWIFCERQNAKTVLVELKCPNPIENPTRCVSSLTRSMVPLLSTEMVKKILYNKNYLKARVVDDEYKTETYDNLLPYQVFQIVSEIYLAPMKSRLNQKAAEQARKEIEAAIKKYKEAYI